MVLWRGGFWKWRGRDSPWWNGAKSWVAGPSLAMTQSQRLCRMPHCFHASLIQLPCLTSTTVAVFPLDAHLPSGLRRKMDERCLIGNDVGSVGLVAAGGQGTDASVVHAGACCRVGACVPRWPAGAGAA